MFLRLVHIKSPSNLLLSNKDGPIVKAVQEKIEFAAVDTIVYLLEVHKGLIRNDVEFLDYIRPTLRLSESKSIL